MNKLIVIIGSGKVILTQFLELVKIGHTIVGILPDRKNLEFNWKDYTTIGLIDETELYSLSWDLAFMNEFGSLLKLPVGFNRPIINYHSGLLPRFRGKSSNLLSFLNSQNIGLTVHLIDSKMDSGKILHKKSFEYQTKEPYENIASKIHLECVDSISKVINCIENGTYLNIAADQIYYSTKLRPSDGVFNDFSFPLEFYYKMFLIFNSGTGVFISYKNERIRVKGIEVSEFNNIDLKYYLIGTIVNKINCLYFVTVANGYLILDLDKDLMIGNRLDGHRFYFNSDLEK